MIKQLKRWGMDFLFIGLFFILYFSHSRIDIIRIPFFIFILFQLYRKTIDRQFLIDPISAGVLFFALSAAVSNAVNGIAQNEIVTIVNWLFPYYLAKYAVEFDRTDVERVMLILVTFSVAFSLVGIFGAVFDVNSVFGIQIFKKDRLIFTLRGINKAGFYLAVTWLLTGYFLIKSRFRITRQTVVYFLCFLIVAVGLLMTQERKSILVTGLLMLLLLVIYKHYRILVATLIAAVLIVMASPLPDRFEPKKILVHESLLGRYNAWEASLGLIPQKPVFGHGYPSFRDAYTRYYHQNKENFRFTSFHGYPVAHNLNLNVLVETGLMGCLALNSIFFGVRRFFTYRRSMPLLFILGTVIVFVYISTQAGNFVHSATRTDLTFLVFGFYYGLERKFSDRTNGL